MGVKKYDDVMPIYASHKVGVLQIYDTNASSDSGCQFVGDHRCWYDIIGSGARSIQGAVTRRECQSGINDQQCHGLQ